MNHLSYMLNRSVTSLSYVLMSIEQMLQQLCSDLWSSLNGSLPLLGKTELPNEWINKMQHSAALRPPVERQVRFSDVHIP